jgi:hypothetical protein
MTLNDWQRVAREFGDHRLSWEIMVQQTPDEPIGDWLPSEPTAKEILRLRKRVEALERVAHDCVMIAKQETRGHGEGQAEPSLTINAEVRRRMLGILVKLVPALNAAKEADDA